MKVKKRWRSGASVPEIARQRELACSTIWGHLASAVEAGEAIELDRLFTAGEREEITAAFARAGNFSLGAIREALGDRFEYGALRIFRAAQRQGR